MTKKKRQRNERDNAAWQAADIAIRKIQKAQLTDDEKKLVFTLSDKDKECVAFFFFLIRADAQWDPSPRFLQRADKNF